MSIAAHLTSPAFKENAKEALADPQLQSALHGIETGIVDRRRLVVSQLPEFEALRDSARDIKNHTLAHLDNSRRTFLRLVEKSRSFDEGQAQELVANRDYQALDQMVIEHLLG